MRWYRKFFLFLTILFVSPLLWSKTITIRIRNQSQFNGLHSMLDSMVSSYDVINVRFDAGKYFYDLNNRIQISKENKCEISFFGDGNVVISSSGEFYSIDEAIESYQGFWYKVPLKKHLDKYSTFQDDEGRIVPICDTGYLNDSLHTNISTAQIEIVDSAGGVARILLPSECKEMLNHDHKYFRNSRICYKSQWSDAYCPILYSDNNYLYFKLNASLKKNIRDYVTNGYEWGGTFGGAKSQAFFVTNLLFSLRRGQVMWDDNYIYIPWDVRKLHVSRFHKFASFGNCKGKISFENLAFIGSAIAPFIEFESAHSDSVSSDLFSFVNTESVSFSNCIFTGLGVNVCRSYDSSGISVSKCVFYENYTDGIMGLQGCSDVIFEENIVQNSHKIITYKSVFSLNKCSNCVILNNKFTNVSRTILGLGESMGEDNIRVVGNIIHNTDDFNQYHRRNMSCDTGILVYSWSGASCVISNNVIYNIVSNFGFHGIMIDDGVGNVAIMNNLIFNIGDECIHNWKYKSQKPLNLNNKLDNNILLGKVNYCGYDVSLKNNASYSNNVLLESSVTTYNLFVNATEILPNAYLSPYEFSIVDNKVAVSKKIFKRFKSVSNVRDFLTIKR